MLLLLLPGALAADLDPRWTLTVDPLTTVLGFVHLQVEHTLGGHASLYAGPSLKLFNSPLGIATGYFQGYGVEAGVRAFPWGKAPSGPWLMARGVLAAVVTYRMKGGGSLQETAVVTPGGYTSALAGYTGILGPGLVLSGGLGVSYFSYGPNQEIYGFLPAAHTTIGWAF